MCLLQCASFPLFQPFLPALCPQWPVLEEILLLAFKQPISAPVDLTLIVAATGTAKSLQSCPTLCDPTVGSAPGSPVPGILQARTLKWVAISFSCA